MSTEPIIQTILPLGFPWRTRDPFLFCVYHDDAYPAGNGQMGPAASLAGRNIGQDFEGKDGWRMYHGETIPGFPKHPHRGFETVTVVRRGLVDHSDSMGAGARYGGGDVQWLTAGRGIQHAEMMPLLKNDGPNPLELFQIWLNLPKAKKMAEPHFAMFWQEKIPRIVEKDSQNRATEIVITAGAYGDLSPLPPPPNSWAASPQNDVAIWTLKMAPGAEWTLPPAKLGSHRSLYFFAGSTVEVAQKKVSVGNQVDLRPDAAVRLVAGDQTAELLLLQGQPIGEPIAQYGPFVMNTRAEIQQAFLDYERTHFGGWPWPASDPVHPKDAGRFARRPDGSLERPV